MEDKKEVKYNNCYLSTNTEYSLEELTKECENNFNQYYSSSEADRIKKGFKLTRYTIEASEEDGYYGDYSASFIQQIYRTETDQEYSDRISKNEKEMQKRERERLMREAVAFTKKKELEKLQKDPEYKKFLELKQKFNQK